MVGDVCCGILNIQRDTFDAHNADESDNRVNAASSSERACMIAALYNDRRGTSPENSGHFSEPGCKESTSWNTRAATLESASDSGASGLSGAA